MSAEKSSSYYSTFASYLGSSSLLAELPDPASPCSSNPLEEDEEDEELLGDIPDASDPLWPRFHAVWGGEHQDAHAPLSPHAPPVPASPGSPTRLSGRHRPRSPEPGMGLAKALRMFRDHGRWREREAMDSVLEVPQPLFHFFKQHYSHCFHKRAMDGQVVMLEKCGQFAGLAAACGAPPSSAAFSLTHSLTLRFLSAAANGVGVGEAARHCCALNEFAARELDARPFPGGRVLRIVDCAELSLWELGASVVGFARGITRVLGPNYPERVERIFLVRTSSSFALCFNLMSTMWTRHLLEKVQVFSASPAGIAAARAALLEHVAEEDLPSEFGGGCSCQGGCWRGAPEEKALWAAVEATTPPRVRRGGKEGLEEAVPTESSWY